MARPQCGEPAVLHQELKPQVRPKSSFLEENQKILKIILQRDPLGKTSKATNKTGVEP
jgi:hypothetical protein